MSNWIPVSERLPTREDADEHGLVRYQSYRARWVGLWNGSRVEYDNEPATHWHSLPPYTPPELMPTNEECDQLAQDIWASRWSAARDTGTPVIRAWFADVTARIEREKGK